MKLFYLSLIFLFTTVAAENIVDANFLMTPVKPSHFSFDFFLGKDDVSKEHDWGAKAVVGNLYETKMFGVAAGPVVRFKRMKQFNFFAGVPLTETILQVDKGGDTLKGLGYPIQKIIYFNLGLWAGVEFEKKSFHISSMIKPEFDMANKSDLVSDSLLLEIPGFDQPEFEKSIEHDIKRVTFEQRLQYTFPIRKREVKPFIGAKLTTYYFSKQFEASTLKDYSEWTNHLMLFVGIRFNER